MFVYAEYSFVFALILAIVTGAKNGRKSFSFGGSETAFNSDHLQDFRIEIHSNRESLDIYFDVEHDFPQDHWVTIVFSKKNGKSPKYHTLFKSEDKLCYMVEGKKPSLMTPVVLSIWNMGKFPSCPVPKGNYSWCNLTGGDLNFPPIFAGQYKVQIEFFFRKRPQTNFILNMTLLMELK